MQQKDELRRRHVREMKAARRATLANPELVDAAVDLPDGRYVVPIGGQCRHGRIGVRDEKTGLEIIAVLKERPGFPNLRLEPWSRYPSTPQFVVWGDPTTPEPSRNAPQIAKAWAMVLYMRSVGTKERFVREEVVREWGPNVTRTAYRTFSWLDQIVR